MHIEVTPFHRVEEIKKDTGNGPWRSRLNVFKVTLAKLIYSLAGFLTARAVVMGAMSPFGAAFFAVSYADEFPYLTGVAIVAGLITSGMGLVPIVRGIVTLLMFALVVRQYPRLLQSAARRAVILFVCSIISSLLLSVGNVPIIYDYIYMFIEALISFVMVFAFSKATPSLQTLYRRRSPDSDELVAISLLLAVMIIGFSGLAVIRGISLSNVLGVLLVLVFSLEHGTTVAAAAGTGMGFLLGMGAPNPLGALSSFAFSGLVSGLFRKFGRLGVSLSFLLANSVITLYANGSTEVLINIYEILLAILFFLALPKKAISFFGSFSPERGEGFKSHADKLRESAVQQIKSIADAFNSISTIFTGLADESSLPSNEISAMFERVSANVCSNCTLKKNCWEHGFQNTYNGLFRMLGKIEKLGQLTPHEIAPELRRCLFPDELTEAFNISHELYKQDLLWGSRVDESREIIARQLSGVSVLMENMASELNSHVTFNERLELGILHEAQHEKIPIKDVWVTRSAQGRYKIVVSVANCGGFGQCKNALTKLVSRLAGVPMERASRECCHKDRYCPVTYVEAEEFSVKGAAAVVRKEEIAGDNHTFVRLEDGRYILILSDGMGVGSKAGRESTATVELIKNMLRAGFDKDITLNMINSVLVSKSAESSFATIDISMIDLKSGRTEFIKCGAAATFIKRTDGVEVVRSSSLPVGLLKNADVEVHTKHLRENDIIIMVTDGILDAKRDSVRKEDWVKELLLSYDDASPDMLADAIIQTAKDLSNGQIRDDMSVMAARLSRRTM